MMADCQSTENFVTPAQIDPVFHFARLPPLSLYVHIPWCLKKCPYCDFNSHAVRDDLNESAYIQALLEDLEFELPHLQGRNLTSIFIGGGTPSLFSPESIYRLLQGVLSVCSVNADLEVTLEANPGTFEQHKFSEFHSAGINRLSVGVQSFNDAMLKSLGRVHDGATAQNSVNIARQAGFDNLNLDLMFGLPGQSLLESSQDIQTAIGLQPDHISYYQLTIEPNTLFHAQPPSLPMDDELWRMQRNGQKILADYGYTQYEVSAYSRAGQRCRHNLNYWQFGDYLGIGAGAHGKITDLASQSIIRRKKYRQPKQYVRESQRGSVEGSEQKLTHEDVILEFMMNAIRLTEGFPNNLFRQRTGLSLDLVGGILDRVKAKGLVVSQEDMIQATPLGEQYLNELLLEFMPEHV